MEKLSEFNFTIIYCPGEKNGKTDTLSCRIDPELKGGGKATHLLITLFNPG